jgi:hypothetical protein
LKYRKEPISQSKLQKQDAAWQDVKQCLGWDYAGASKHLLVAEHRRSKTQASLAEALSQNRVGLKKWQSLLGQLRSLVLGMPSLEGQFSLLQAGLTHQKEGRVRITAAVKEQLSTFQDLLHPSSRPVRVKEIVPGRPAHIGACNAAKPGMGGVWFTQEGRALLWREPFPQVIQDQIVSFNNPTGKLTTLI